MDNLLCERCGHMYNNMESLKRHLKSHNNNKHYYLECNYNSPRKDTLKRHTKTHQRQLLSNFEATPKRPKTSRSRSPIETRAYQADPKNTNSYIYQQSLPKNKEIFPWILRELDTQTRHSRPYHQPEPITIPLEAIEPLQDPRPQPSTSLSDEIEYLLNQEYSISAPLNELDEMLRNIESEDREEDTPDENEDLWKIIDYINIWRGNI